MIDVNDGNFKDEVLNSDKRVLVDFNADWCGPCRMLRPVLEEIASSNNDVKIVSINIDNNENLAKEYGVMSIPCLVLFEKGKEIDRSVGLISKRELEEFIKHV